MIQEFCHSLKEKRLKLKLSVEDVVEKTKLHPTVIKDIENCNLENVTSTYLKGFIKIYAKFLEVDIGEALNEITTTPSNIVTKPKRDVKKKESVPISEQLKKIGEKFNPQIRKRIAVIIVVIILVYSAFSVSRFIIKKISGLFKSRPVVEEKSEKNQQQEIIIEKNQDLAVTLTAKKRCFIKVKVDGNVLFENVLNKGAVESWIGKKELEFKISDGSAVYLEVNGKSIPTLTSIRKSIKSLKINHSGITVEK